ncbi:MAG: ankyrin repeat domain-containing protein [Parachlamydiaceae bacterium]
MIKILVNQPDRDGLTSLTHAVAAGDVKVVDLMLAPGIIPHQGSLCLAAKLGHLHVFKILHERGSDIEELDSEGYTPLMRAANVGQSGYTIYPLRCVPGHDHVEIVNYLIKAGAHVNRKVDIPTGLYFQKDRSALDQVCSWLNPPDHLKERHQIVTSLMKARLNFDLLNRQHYLNCMVIIAHEEGIASLLDKGANINEFGYHGTPLQIAASFGYGKIVQYLLKRGANPLARPNE